MGSQSNSQVDGIHIATQIDGSGGSQVRACGSLAGLINGTVSQFVYGLAHSVGSQRSRLGIPLGDGTAVSHHAVVLAQLILGLRCCGQISSQNTGSIELNRSGDTVDDAVPDDAVVVHQNGYHGNIILGFTVCLGSGRLAVGNAGGDVQAGLQRALCDRCFHGRFGLLDNRSLGGSGRLMSLHRAGAVSIINNGCTCTAGKHADQQCQG